jgi:hypothetical protein
MRKSWGNSVKRSAIIFCSPLAKVASRAMQFCHGDLSLPS